jgi:hypothetical protein
MATKIVKVVKEVVVSPTFRGKTLTLPHVEHIGDDPGTKSAVTFDAVSGEALVSPEQAAGLVEHYGAHIVRPGSKKQVEYEVPAPEGEKVPDKE